VIWVEMVSSDGQNQPPRFLDFEASPLSGFAVCT